MEFENVADDLLKMMEHDFRIRKKLIDSGDLFDGYNKEMEQVHLSNACKLEDIIGKIGWPTTNKVGEEAKNAAMLVVQHAISLPEFQRKCLVHLEDAILKGEDGKKSYAYLYDRVCFNERRPQKFGTQFDWDIDGKMNPWSIENLENINELRKEFGLNSIENQTQIILSEIALSGEKPPVDFNKRQQEIYEWSKKTGWIK